MKTRMLVAALLWVGNIAFIVPAVAQQGPGQGDPGQAPGIGQGMAEAGAQGPGSNGGFASNGGMAGNGFGPSGGAERGGAGTAAVQTGPERGQATPGAGAPPAGTPGPTQQAPADARAVPAPSQSVVPPASAIDMSGTNFPPAPPPPAGAEVTGGRAVAQVRGELGWMASPGTGFDPAAPHGQPVQTDEADDADAAATVSE